jgi:chromosome segregation ATPase
MIEEMKGSRSSELRAQQFLKGELEQTVEELSQEVEDLTRRKEESDAKNRELQANLKQLYNQVREEMDKLKLQTTESDEALAAEKTRSQTIINELRDQLSRESENGHRSIALLEQENERMQKTLGDREREFEGNLAQERDFHAKALKEVRQQHQDQLDRSLRSAHQSESTVLGELENERRQARLLSAERDEDAQVKAQLRAEVSGLKRELSRSQDQNRKLEESKAQHTSTISKLMTANKELQRLIEHTRNDLDFIRRVEDLKRDQELYEQSTANLQSFMANERGTATPSRTRLGNTSSTPSRFRKTPVASTPPDTLR